MTDKNKSMDMVIKSLEERAKELNCLYKIEELLTDPSLDEKEVIQGIAHAIPPGWQYSDICVAKVVVNTISKQTPGFKDTPWRLTAPIIVQDEPVGRVEVHYLEKMPNAGEGPFLKEERKLINTIADRLGHYILHHRLKKVFQDWQSQKAELDGSTRHRPEWSIVIEMLRKTDHNLFSVISRRMINHLFCRGVDESKKLFEKLGSNLDFGTSTSTEVNRPSKKQVLESSYNLGMEIFTIASKYFTEDELLNQIQKWVHEERSHFLVKALANLNTPLSEVADAIRRYHHINPDNDQHVSPIGKGIRVSLIRRFLTDQLQFIDIAKSYSRLQDFYDLLQNMIFPPESHGKLGGKSAGLFLARKIIKVKNQYEDILKDVKIPKTWYITSDGLMSFMYYNNLEDIIEQKYKDIEDIRKEYPHIIQAFKNSNFPAEIVNGLSRALDDFGDNPIIVRSSSLLEDRMGSAFAGKYKSLFLGNQGSKKHKLETLMDAIAEVYASTFGPDPIGYRFEKGLLDFNEEMGIMIQEVVGKKVGKYFLPAYAGVAFSMNEFRWSPRIDREDGLIRMVPGLGTRAVDRIGDDYPMLIAPGKPDLRVNLSYQEMVGYSPKSLDVINLETNTFETTSIENVIKEAGNQFPMLNEVFSILEEKHIKKPVGLGIDTKKHDIVVTFENLISTTDHIQKINAMLKILTEKLKTPVDIEFACDGKNLYLLQCRPQSETSDRVSAIIPQDISQRKILFTANKYVSNGKVPDIAHIVYINPEKYYELTELNEMREVGKIVGKLNKLLPKKTFILMGPGRWGSRDDPRLGVKVSYSDIHNTAVLVEVAEKKGNYVPDLSFGTHFFQDLVEASIRYLPLYPDNDGVIFNKGFLMENENTLTRYLPEYERFKDIVRVINVREATGGQILRLLMNADDDEALAYFSEPGSKSTYDTASNLKSENIYNEPLQWRLRMTDSIASMLDMDRFGVKGLYLFGTVFNETAGPNSDIDLLVVFEGNEEQKKELRIWFEGWNHCLSQINYNKSGYLLQDFLDVIIMSEKEIREQPYYSDLIDINKNNSRKLL